MNKMIVYIGNMMSSKGGSVSVIETLSLSLSRHYPVVSFSSASNQLVRILAMLKGVWSNRRKASLVLIDSYSSKAFWYSVTVSMLCRLLYIPYIPIIHGGNFPARLKKSPFWCRQVFGNSRINVSPSHYLYDHFNNAGFDVVYIPNTVETDDFPFKHRTTAAPRLLWVRAFDQTYNPLLAVETIAKLVDEFPGIELCMVGAEKDGSLEKTKQEVERLKLTKNIRFTGPLPRKEWALLSRHYDIFINTTNFDNMPLSIIEAMALGMIIVSTNVGGLPYLLTHEENALLVPPCDSSRMSEEIRRILNSPQLQGRLSASARIKAEEFSWVLVEKEWLDLLKKYIK